jgi:putative ABC transport system permease protein
VTNRLVLANVLHRPMRAFISILAISLEVLMILMVVGITSGMIVDSANRQQGIGADIFVQPPNASIIFSTGSASMPISDTEKLAKVKGVRAVTPVLTQLETEGGLVTISGIDLKSYDEVSGGFTYLAGGPFSSPKADEMIVDDLYSQSNRLKVGESHTLKGRSFKVVGEVVHGKGARVFVPIQTLQELVGAEGRASMILVKCQAPSQNSQVIREIESVLPGYSIFAVQDWVTRIVNTRPPAFNLFIDVIVAVAVIIGSFAVFLSMYTTIAERTRDIGILKSLGASKFYIVNIILRESIALCIFGLLLGLLATIIGKTLVEGMFPTQQVLLSTSWILRAGILVLASGLLGAVYPALQAAGKDPIRALAYE